MSSGADRPIVEREDPGAVLAELRGRLASYELALRTGGIGVWEWDVGDDDVRWSGHLEELAGMVPGSFEGRYASFLARLHPEDVARVRDRVQAALDGRRDYDVEYRLLRRDNGAERWMHSTGVVLRDDNGQPVRMVGSRVDITDRKTAELRLRETSDLLQYVLDTSPIVLFAGTVVDGEFVPSYASGNSERVQGWSAEAFLSGEVAWKDLLHPDDAERVIAANDRAVTDGHSEWETRLRQPDGRYGSYRTVLRVTHEPDGEISYVGCTLDVTESHRMEQQLRQAQKMEAVGQLAGGIAHDFNNLLQAISGYTESARAASVAGGEADRALVEAQHAARQASALVGQLLTFSRREELVATRIDVASTLRGMRELLDTTVGERVRLELEIDREVGSVWLGQGQLEQMVLNLAVNARDAMPDGGALRVSAAPVTVDEETASAEALPAGTYVRLAVADTGSGMSGDVRASAMEPFFTTKPVGSGTGLGLATVYGIVSKAGGRLAIASAPNAGTTVELHLPTETNGGTGQVGLLRSSDAPDPLPRTARVPDERVRILLVDDHPQVRSLLATALERMGYDVVAAKDGIEALGLVAAGEPRLDLVITDIVMPDLNGLELVERLRPSLPGLRVLFMSGYADGAGDRRSRKGRGFLQKPFSIAELGAEVSRILTDRLT